MTTTASRPQVRPRALAAVAASSAAVLLLAGCNSSHHTGRTAATASGSPSACRTAAASDCTPSTAKPAPAPVLLTRQAAAKILARYITLNNEANRKRSPAVNGLIETATVREQSRAEFEMYPYWTPADRKQMAPFTYNTPRFYIPRTVPTAQRPWFAVLAHGSWSTKQWAYMVFTQVSAGQWRLAAESALDTGQSVPKITVDAQGYATALDPSAPGLAMTPASLPTAVNDLYLTGGKKAGRALATTPDSTAQRKAFAAEKTFLRPYARSQFVALTNPYPAAYALRTTDGGALVIASSAHGEHQYVVIEGGYITLGAHSGERAWDKQQHITDVTVTFSCLDVAAIPPAGRDRAVRELGSDCETVGAG